MNNRLALEIFDKFQKKKIDNTELFYRFSHLVEFEINGPSLITKLYRIKNKLNKHKGKYRSKFLDETFSVLAANKNSESGSAAQPSDIEASAPLPGSSKCKSKSNVKLSALQKEVISLRNRLRFKSMKIKKLLDRNKLINRKLFRPRQSCIENKDKEAEIHSLKKQLINVKKLISVTNDKFEKAKMQANRVPALGKALKGLKKDNVHLTSKNELADKQINELQKNDSISQWMCNWKGKSD